MSEKRPPSPPSDAPRDPSTSDAADNAPVSQGPMSASPFNRNFQRTRGPRQAQQTSGRVLPPAPAWMAKPLKPPKAKTRSGD